MSAPVLLILLLLLLLTVIMAQPPAQQEPYNPYLMSIWDFCAMCVRVYNGYVAQMNMPFNPDHIPHSMRTPSPSP
jgi:hypothetical protein